MPYFSGAAEELEGKISVQTQYKPVDSGVDAVRLGCHSLSQLCDCHTPRKTGCAKSLQKFERLNLSSQNL